MNRLLVFHLHETSGNQARMAPSAYYIEADYEPVSIRLYAEVAPTRDAKFDIYDDGVSVFSDRGMESVSKTTGVISTLGAGTYITLPANTNSDEMAEDFNDNTIEVGSWVYCNLIDSGGGKNFTVIFELRPLSEDGESSD